MDFLSPLYLLAGAAAAVPLLLHLMRRRIGTRVDFPAVRYLARAEKENSRKLRLRNLLLMLLRVAAVLLVVAAAARPVAKISGGGHAPTALAIVLDNSLSTSTIIGRGPVLDELKAQATAVAKLATEEDRLWVVTANGATFGGGRGAVLNAIAGVEPLAGSGDLDAAFARANSLVRSAQAQEREIVVVTDGQASSWRSVRGRQDMRITAFQPRGEPPSNRAVTYAAASPVRWTPRGAVRARVQTPDSATYRISIEGRTLARGTATRDEEIIVRAAPAERGWTAGTMEVQPDELRGDDLRHFAVWIGPAPGVTVHSTLGIFASSAVDALVEAERVAAGDDLQLVPADQASTLPALLFAPADPVRAGVANRTLERLGVPWRLGPVRRARSSIISRTGVERALDGVTVSHRFVLVPRPGEPADTLAMAGGEAWIVAGKGYVLVASPLTPEASDLPIKAAFVPWLGEVISQRLSEDAGGVMSSRPGAQLARPRGALGLELTGGERLALRSDTITAPDIAGSYFFVSGELRVGALVVNAEPEESDLRRLSSNALRASLGAYLVTDDTLRLASEVFSSAPRRSVMLPILLATLAILLVESVLAGAGHRAKST
ncbi:MAG: VWA domain-containing protein [Gemmatimonadaceae bacterium]